MKKYLIAMMALLIISALSLATYRSYINYNSTILIKNAYWKKVHIQVRKGYNPDPNNNKLIFDQYLTLGQSRSFSVDNGDDIMYRRDIDPNRGDGLHFTNWAYASCDNSATCTVDNP